MTTPPPVREPRPRRWIAWHPLLFAAYPVLFLWSQNLGETTPSDVMPWLGLTVAIAAVALLVLGVLFRDARRAALIVSPVAIGLLMYGHLADLVGPGHLRALAQQAGWIGLAGIGLLAALRLGESHLRRATYILDRVAAVLVLIALVVIVPAQVSAATSGGPALAPGPVSGGHTTKPLRDVYYLILDRYGSDHSLELRYGVRNDITPWLTDHGFRVLADSHANYVKTVLSMASTLNMTHLAGLDARMGQQSPDLEPVFAMLQDNLVTRQFKALGYRYIHVGGYYTPTATDAAADRNLSPGGLSDFAATLYDTTAVPVIMRRLRLVHRSPINERVYQSGQFSWQALGSLRDAAGPKFVFAHILLPHPPYVFARDGSWVDPTTDKRPENERFAAQLGWTNDQLKAWLESVLALPEDRRPIVILQADEGPYTVRFAADQDNFDWSTASADELEEKYGILNAWYLPDGSDPGLYDTMTSVNTFPVLFSGYFGLDVAKLEDRIYTSAGNLHPYEMTDVTNRIPTAAP